MYMERSPELEQMFKAFVQSWRPVESPPCSNNWVAEKQLDGNKAVRHFEKGVAPTRKAIQSLCNKLNKENV
tara:strand:+ start:258 stop:470 length:213 start_codon:yes stop_codon:yes gene_type:complete